jgi:hypothetical protein
MQEPQDTGNTEFILPIICPHCKGEVDLSMIFSLLKPEPKKEEPQVDNGEEDEDEEI